MHAHSSREFSSSEYKEYGNDSELRALGTLRANFNDFGFWLALASLADTRRQVVPAFLNYELLKDNYELEEIITSQVDYKPTGDYNKRLDIVTKVQQRFNSSEFWEQIIFDCRAGEAYPGQYIQAVMNRDILQNELKFEGGEACSVAKADLVKQDFICQDDDPIFIETELRYQKYLNN